MSKDKDKDNIVYLADMVPPDDATEATFWVRLNVVMDDEHHDLEYNTEDQYSQLTDAGAQFMYTSLRLVCTLLEEQYDVEEVE